MSPDATGPAQSSYHRWLKNSGFGPLPPSLQVEYDPRLIYAQTVYTLPEKLLPEFEKLLPYGLTHGSILSNMPEPSTGERRVLYLYWTEDSHRKLKQVTSVSDYFTVMLTSAIICPLYLKNCMFWRVDGAQQKINDLTELTSSVNSPNPSTMPKPHLSISSSCGICLKSTGTNVLRGSPTSIRGRCHSLSTTRRRRAHYRVTG